MMVRWTVSGTPWPLGDRNVGGEFVVCILLVNKCGFLNLIDLKIRVYSLRGCILDLFFSHYRKISTYSSSRIYIQLIILDPENVRMLGLCFGLEKIRYSVGFW
jgi:hypothetical protein